MTKRIINRVALAGLIAWAIVLLVGLVIEITMHHLLFEEYLSASVGWMVICLIMYRLSREKPACTCTKNSASGEQPATADPARRGAAEP